MSHKLGDAMRNVRKTTEDLILPEEKLKKRLRAIATSKKSKKPVVRKGQAKCVVSEINVVPK